MGRTSGLAHHHHLAPVHSLCHSTRMMQRRGQSDTWEQHSYIFRLVHYVSAPGYWYNHKEERIDPPQPAVYMSSCTYLAAVGYLCFSTQSFTVSSVFILYYVGMCICTFALFRSWSGN